LGAIDSQSRDNNIGSELR